MPSVVLDLRSNTKCGIANDPNPGMGLFEEKGRLFLGPWQWYSISGEGAFWGAPASVDGYVSLGSDPRRLTLPEERREMGRLLNIDPSRLPDTDLIDLLAHYILGIYADPTGQNRVKPLRMSRRGIKLHLGSFGLVLKGAWTRNHPNFEAALAVRMADYRHNKDSGVPLEVLQRWTGHDMLAYYGRTGNDLLDNLVPAEYLADGWREPETKITDDFSTNTIANYDLTDLAGAGFNPGFSVTGGVLRFESSGGTGSTRGLALHQTVLSSADMYSQHSLAAQDSGGSYHATVARAADASNYYSARYVLASPTIAEMFKRVGGTDSSISAQFEFSTSDLKLQVQSSNQEMFDGGTSLATASDPSLSAGNQAGLESKTQGNGINDHDDFEASDELAAGGIPPAVLRRRIEEG